MNEPLRQRRVKRAAKPPSKQRVAHYPPPNWTGRTWWHISPAQPILCPRGSEVVEKTKMRSFILSVLTPALLVGCSTNTCPKFVESGNQSIVQGKGGAVRQIGGVDFWESGEPDRPYQVLGVIRDDTGAIWTSEESLRKKEARLVHENGGDGAIVLKEQEKAGKIRRTGTIYYRGIIKLVVVRYGQ